MIFSVLLDLDNVCGLNELLHEGSADEFAQLVPTSATLAGLVELGALAETSPDRKHRELLTQFVERQSARWPVLKNISHAFQNAQAKPNSVLDMHATPDQEVWALADKHSITDNQFTLYLLRFERSLKAAGFPAKFATAVAAAFSEMADNVIQHSGSSQFRVAGVAGFRVAQGAMNYVVTDVGQGALSKLKATTKWASLNSERDALIAIGRDGATSRPLKCGSGYFHVFESFLDRRGSVKMRSGEGLAHLTGNLNMRHAEGANTQYFTGFRVFVSCSLNDEGSELVC